MTFHRFVYKIVWKKRILVLLIFLCLLLAIITTTFHAHLLPGRNKKSHIQPKYNEPFGPGEDKIDEIDELDVNEVQNLRQKGYELERNNDGKVVLKGFVEDVRKKALQMFQENGGKAIDVNPSGRDVALRFEGLERMSKRPKEQPLKPYHSPKLYYDPQKPPEPFGYWRESNEKQCGGKFSTFFNEFAQLTDVIFDLKYFHGKQGGEKIYDVFLQAEEEEYYRYDMGCLRMDCEERPNVFFNNKNHLNDLVFGLKTKQVTDTDVQERITKGFHLLVTRYEYANIYHTMTDWYNAFILMNFFNQTQTETNVLLVDGHPEGSLDPVWHVLFNSTRRVSDLSPVTQYKQLTFNILGYNSHFLDHSTETIPLIEEFTQFFMNSYRIPYNARKLNCDTISVLFIWRRDYLAHPRNPTGTVSRKIANERELIDHLQTQYPNFHIKGLQIDLFEMQQQLRYVSESDVLIGMHGAGLTHGLFLPKHGGLIELIPNYWSAAMEHFMAIARWKFLKYERWVNTDPQNEGPDDHTTIPTQILDVLFRSLIRQMGCLPAAAE